MQRGQCYNHYRKIARRSLARTGEGRDLIPSAGHRAVQDGEADRPQIGFSNSFQTYRLRLFSGMKGG